MKAGRLAGVFRSRRTSASMLAAATAAVVVMAATATGIPVDHVSANDGGVWVVNDTVPGQFAEFNVPIRQIAKLVPPSNRTFPSYDLNVLQAGTTVLGVDRLQKKILPIDVATGAADVAGGVAYTGVGHVALGGGVAALLEAGNGKTPAGVWAEHVGAGQVPSIRALDPVANKPLARLAGAEAVAVDTAGDVFAASPSALVEVPSVRGQLGPPKVVDYPNGPLTTGAVALTTVGTVPVVMDTTATKPVLLFPLSGREVTLQPVNSAGSGSSFALQQPGPVSATVLVASPTKLFAVPLGPGLPQALATDPGSGGVPAQPVDLAGCAFAAWSGSPGERAEACPGAAPLQAPLNDRAGRATVASDLVYRVNNGDILLNDDANGSAWTVQGSVAQVLANKDWQRVLQGLTAHDTSQSTNKAAASQTPRKRPPQLHNPTLYARAGIASTLHVLDQDVDPGGSILSVLSVTPSGPGFTAAVSPDNESVIVTLAGGVATPVTLHYEVVDGFGLTATGAFTVQPTTAEHPPTPPAQPIPLRHVVAGGTVSMQVLGGWRDPENDALTVSQASVPAGDGTVGWTSDGLITYTAPGDNTSDRNVTVTYQVTDGRSAPVTSTLDLVVLGRGDLTAYPPTAVPDAVKVTVGKPATFDPLANDVFGADPIHPGAELALAGPVSGLAGLSVSTNTSSGQLTLTATVAGTYSLVYQASYGSGVSPPTQILVEAVKPPGTALPPVTTPVSVLLHGQYPATVDVLQSDYDPSGGLLSVVGVSAPSSFQATIVDGEYLRIVATTPAPPPTSVVDYQVSNGSSDPVTGQVTVYWEPPILPPPPPDVPASYATVRAGDETNIAVLASAVDPDGESVHLLAGGTPDAVTVSQTNPGSPYPTGLGSASVAGSYIRYAAPPGGAGPKAVTAPEAVTLSFVVESESGVRVTGQAFVTVNPTAKSLDTPPAPAEVDARVSSGGTVTIPIPTTGVTPDGDSATVTGITTAPHIGRIMSYNADSITYQAYPTAVGSSSFAGGTDSFTYSMEGPSGLTAQGLVRVSVTPPTQVQAPVAVGHEITAAPGQTVDIDLLAGDIIAPGDQITVEPLDSTNTSLPAGTSLVGSDHATLQVVAPTGSTPLDIAYGITDGTAAPSVGHVVVRDQPNFALSPVAADYFPTAPAPKATSIKVDVLAKDSDPGGTPGDLVLVGSPDASVDPSSPASLLIPVTAYPRSVPYEIRSSRTGAVAVGVVHVPAPSVGPQLKPGQVINVPAGGTKSVNIGDYITDSAHPVRLTTNDAQQASPNGGLSVTVNSNTAVTLKAAPGYTGPGSLTVQVIDAASLSAPGAHVATFTIPVQVGAPEPIVRCPSYPLKVVESGAPVDADIAGICQVWTPTGASPNTLTYTEKWAQPIAGLHLGWAPGQTGRVVRVTAGSSAVGGSVGRITVGVTGSSPAGQSTLQVQAVEAGPASVAAINVPGVQTGSTATIDVAQFVSSPLSKPQIVVVHVGQPSQGHAQVTFSGSQVRITPAKGVHGTVTFPITVSDQGVARKDRYVAGQITLQVLDNPGAPTGLTGVPGNGLIKLSWNPAPPNGSPIESYQVSMSGGGTATTSGTSYTWSGLKNGQSYTFNVTATNRVGVGPALTGGPFEPNSTPDAPSNVVATGQDKQATVKWTAPFDGGKPIDHYIVSISPATASSTVTVPGNVTSYSWTGLNNSVGPYTFDVVAHNADGVGPVSSQSNAVYTHGVPATPPAPSAAGKVSTDQTTTTVTVTWPVVTDCNDAQPCASYTVTQLKGGAPAGTATVAGGQCSSSACSATFGPLADDGAGYTYELSATNQEGDVSATSAPSSPVVYAVGYPSQITDLSVSPGNTSVTATFTLPPSHGASISEVQYFLNGSTSPNGAWANPGASGQKVSEQINGLTNGTNYSVQVSACSQSAGGTSGGCGPLSNSSAAVPYGPPYPPSVAATQSGDNIVYGWSGGGNNGRPVSYYHVCFDSSCSNYGGPGSNTISYACNTAHTITAYVVDTAGQQSSTASASATTAACPPPPGPTISASRGSSGSISPCNTTCYWLNFSVSNFPTGKFTWQCYSKPANNPSAAPSLAYDSSSGPYYVDVTASNQSFNGGSGASGYCIYDPNVYMYAIQIDGVMSNFAN